GFFSNGGKRVFIVRALDTAGAVESSFTLHNRGANTSALTLLLRSADAFSGALGAPIYVLNVNAALPNTGSLATGDRIRIGGGSEAEYRVAAAVGVATDATHVVLNLP